jgi:hypothetical protein
MGSHIPSSAIEANLMAKKATIIVIFFIMQLFCSSNLL